MTNFPQLDIPNASSNVRMLPTKVIGAAAAGSFYLPPNAVLREIIVKETAGNAVTGGLKFGTTSGATDVAAALAVGASAFAFLTDALMLKRTFSSTAPQQIFFDAVAAWN